MEQKNHQRLLPLEEFIEVIVARIGFDQFCPIYITILGAKLFNELLIQQVRDAIALTMVIFIMFSGSETHRFNNLYIKVFVV